MHCLTIFSACIWILCMPYKWMKIESVHTSENAVSIFGLRIEYISLLVREREVIRIPSACKWKDDENPSLASSLEGRRVGSRGPRA